MREIRLSGSEGGGAELNRLSLPLSPAGSISAPRARPGYGTARLPGRLTVQTLERGSLLRVAFPGIRLLRVLLPLSELQRVSPWAALSDPCRVLVPGTPEGSNREARGETPGIRNGEEFQP